MQEADQGLCPWSATLLLRILAQTRLGSKFRHDCKVRGRCHGRASARSEARTWQWLRWQCDLGALLFTELPLHGAEFPPKWVGGTLDRAFGAIPGVAFLAAGALSGRFLVSLWHGHLRIVAGA